MIFLEIIAANHTTHSDLKDYIYHTLQLSYARMAIDQIYQLFPSEFQVLKNNRVIHLRYNRGIVEGWFRRGGGGGRGGCAPSYSVDSCLQWSNGVWWVEVLSYHVFFWYVLSHNLICMINYQHFADLGTVMVWCGLDGGGGGVAVSLWVVFFSSSI